MAMHNPPHTGEFVAEIDLDPNHISASGLAMKLGVAASTLRPCFEGYGASLGQKWLSGLPVA